MESEAPAPLRVPPAWLLVRTLTRGPVGLARDEAPIRVYAEPSDGLAGFTCSLQGLTLRTTEISATNSAARVLRSRRRTMKIKSGVKAGTVDNWNLWWHGQ
jgi:hypothetical protein